MNVFKGFLREPKKLARYVSFINSGSDLLCYFDEDYLVSIKITIILY